MIPFDLETTGVDPKTARPVTGFACVVNADPEAETHRWGDSQWLIDPGVEIPEGATEKHGITTAHARESGVSSESGVRSMTRRLVELVTLEGLSPPHLCDLFSCGEWDDPATLFEFTESHEVKPAVTAPIVGMNVAYDLTIMHRDALRHGVMSLVEITKTLNLTVPCIDVYVLDKHVDPYRKGFRNLGALCETYRVPLDNAHNAEADALATARVAVRLGMWSPYLAEMPILTLHDNQVGWRRTQCVNLQAYFRRSGKKDAVVDPCWPVCLPENHPEEMTDAILGLFDNG